MPSGDRRGGPSAIGLRVEVEQTLVDYTPDWDVRVERPQWLALLPQQHVDLQQLLSAFDADSNAPSALALIDVRRQIIFDVLLRTIHAPTASGLAKFLSGLEDCIRSERSP